MENDVLIENEEKQESNIKVGEIYRVKLIEITDSGFIGEIV